MRLAATKPALMSLCLLSVTGSTSAYALDCPDLSGNYSCTFAESPDMHDEMHIDQSSDALSINANRFVLDGHTHTGAYGIKYVIQCDESSLIFRVRQPQGQSTTIIYSPSPNGHLLVTRQESPSLQARPYQNCERK